MVDEEENKRIRRTCETNSLIEDSFPYFGTLQSSNISSNPPYAASLVVSSSSPEPAETESQRVKEAAGQVGAIFFEDETTGNG